MKGNPSTGKSFFNERIIFEFSTILKYVLSNFDMLRSISSNMYLQLESELSKLKLLSSNFWQRSSQYVCNISASLSKHHVV